MIPFKKIINPFVSLTTIGTAGKVFTNEPGEWKPLPRIYISDWDEPVKRIENRSTALNPLARLIDHTVLHPETTESEILAAAIEAKTYHFFSVCVPPCYVALAKNALKGSEVKVCSVVGFPLGSATTMSKNHETKDAIANGADEIDMVLNIGLLKSKKIKLVLDDIRAVRSACQGKVLKVILENCLLTQAEKIEGCKLTMEAGADFVKTSTGFSKSGATVEDIQLMRQAVGPKMGVKAAGGIRDTAFAKALVAAGASRLGTSASVAIILGTAPSAQSQTKTQFLPY